SSSLSLFHSYLLHLYLPSFPTRRSSDLVGGFPSLVHSLEAHKIPNLPLGLLIQLLVFAQEIHVFVGDAGRVLLVEELRDVDLENGQDLEERFKADLVVPVLHPAEIRLLDADTGRQLGLRQVPDRKSTRMNSSHV